MASQNIVQELFLAPSNVKFGIDSILDKVVLKVCNNFLDDIPAGDPRWNKEVPPGLGSSYSMQILQQLKDKQKALQLFLQFLKDCDLWNRLSAVTIRGNVMATVYVLGNIILWFYFMSKTHKAYFSLLNNLVWKSYRTLVNISI